jgi:hypothetical protein
MDNYIEEPEPEPKAQIKAQAYFLNAQTAQLP